MSLPEFTLGIEEEYQIIDPDSRQLTSYIQEFLDAHPPRFLEIVPLWSHLTSSEPFEIRHFAPATPFTVTRFPAMATHQLAESDIPRLEACLSRLRDPTTYPDRPERVKMVETSLSWVFLTDRFAYKLICRYANIIQKGFIKTLISPGWIFIKDGVRVTVEQGG